MGGYEIAGIAGAALAAAARGTAVVLDGVISTAAGLIAYLLNPDIRGYLIAGHRSVEISQTAALEIRVHGDPHKSTLPTYIDLWKSRDHLLQQLTISQNTKASGLLSDQHISIREEGHAPSLPQSIGKHGHFRRTCCLHCTSTNHKN